MHRKSNTMANMLRRLEDETGTSRSSSTSNSEITTSVQLGKRGRPSIDYGEAGHAAKRPCYQPNEEGDNNETEYETSPTSLGDARPKILSPRISRRIDSLIADPSSSLGPFAAASTSMEPSGGDYFPTDELMNLRENLDAIGDYDPDLDDLLDELCLLDINQDEGHIPEIEETATAYSPLKRPR